VRIPFDNVVTEALVSGTPVVEYSEGKVSQELKTLWQEITSLLEKTKQRV